MENENGVILHKASPKENGVYRDYFVRKEGDSYVFRCVEWQIIEPNGDKQGAQKVGNSFQTKEDAIAELNKFYDEWEK